VDWSVRSYCVGTLGWFDGNPTSLGTLAPNEEAKRFVKLIGGPDAVLAATDEAISNGDYQWALQLIDRLIALDENNEGALSNCSTRWRPTNPVAPVTVTVRLLLAMPPYPLQ
jgi:uncharacterized sulfatase